MYIPVNINISDKNVLIVGGGNVALHKISTISLFTKNIVVVAPSIKREINQFTKHLHLRDYKKSDLNGKVLVYACTDNSELNLQIKKEANKKNILVCVADKKEHCDFISPAVFKKDHMIVSVSSSGEDIKKTLSWRNKIRKVFSDG